MAVMHRGFSRSTGSGDLPVRRGGGEFGRCQSVGRADGDINFHSIGMQRADALPARQARDSAGQAALLFETAAIKLLAPDQKGIDVSRLELLVGFDRIAFERETDGFLIGEQGNIIAVDAIVAGEGSLEAVIAKIGGDVDEYMGVAGKTFGLEFAVGGHEKGEDDKGRQHISRITPDARINPREA